MGLSRILHVWRSVCVLRVGGKERGTSWRGKAQLLKWCQQEIDCVRKKGHVFVHTRAPSTKGFHIQLSVSRANESSPQWYHGVSFQQLSLSVSCPSLVHDMAYQSQAVCVVLSSWPKWSCAVVSQDLYVTKISGTGISALAITISSLPTTSSFQWAWDKR